MAGQTVLFSNGANSQRIVPIFLLPVVQYLANARADSVSEIVLQETEVCVYVAFYMV